MLNYFFTSILLLFTLSIHSQTSSCFQIESILVDACGSPEGPNEMVRMRIGPADLNVVDLTVTWPFNPYRGICQDATTASNVAYMNSTIQSCGFFKEPVGGILPANAKVLFITSVDFDPTAHDYAGLQDTIVVIFQCAGNTQGHFANWQQDCVEANGNRTINISFGVGCSQTVTYNRCYLTNQNGGIGGTTAERDGARVDVAADGTVSYSNAGCTIPYEQLTIQADFINSDGAICPSGSVEVNGTVNGSASTVSWYSNFGTFDNPAEQSCTYTLAAATQEDHYIYFSAVNSCEELLIDSLYVTMLASPEVTIDANTLNSCDPGSITLTAAGADNFVWNTGEITATITPQTSGTYTVTGSNACGTDEESVGINFGALPTCSILSNNSTICAGENITLEATSDATNYQWNGGTANSLTTLAASEGWYVFSAENECGMCIDSVYITVLETIASFIADPISGNAPLTVNFSNTSENFTNSAWYVDGVLQSSDLNFSTEFTEIGVYQVELFVADNVSGCSDSYSITITVFNQLDVHIPNVFTPNNDLQNDYFGIKTSQFTTGSLTIFNRWGGLVNQSEFSTEPEEFMPLWNGEISGQKAAEGVYFYTLELIDEGGESKTFDGFIQLIR